MNLTPTTKEFLWCAVFIAFLTAVVTYALYIKGGQ